MDKDHKGYIESRIEPDFAFVYIISVTTIIWGLFLLICYQMNDIHWIVPVGALLANLAVIDIIPLLADTAYMSALCRLYLHGMAFESLAYDTYAYGHPGIPQFTGMVAFAGIIGSIMLTGDASEVTIREVRRR